MSRRAVGEGSLFFDEGRGRWVAAAEAGLHPRTGKRRRVKVSGATKSQAAARLRDRLAEMDRLDRSALPETVGSLLRLWIERDAPRSKSPKTMEVARSLVRTHLQPGIGRYGLGEFRPEHLEALLEGLAADGLSRATLVKLHSYAAQAFDLGVRRRLVGWNPARVAIVPVTGDPAKPGRALVPSEVRSLLNVAAGERLGAWLVVSVLTGLRPGEVSGLTWRAVDLEAGRLVVFQSLSWVGGRPELKGPKTKRTRTLGLPAVAVEALQRHRVDQVGERLLMRGRWPVEWDDLVFVNSEGRPVDPSNLRRLVARLAVEAGIEGRVTPYDLRHTATSILSAAGVAPELLADLLGHVDTRMVYRHYRHPITPTVDVAAEHMGRALGLG